MHKIINIILMTLLFGMVSLHAQRGLKLTKEIRDEQRVALVIGNNKYKNLSKLKNPVNDARAMRSILQKRGFKVIYKENASKRQMKKLLKDFAYKLKGGGTGLYYFAGHGVNVDGENFLVGVDSIMDDKDEVEYETLALNFITKKMKSANNRLNIIILDACRNDPFSRSGGGGLAPISDAKGMFVAYATEAGSVASDGKGGKNGIFTSHLIKNMQEKGTTIEDVFKNTRVDVLASTNGKQSPGVYNQLVGNFYFTLPDTNLHKITTSTKKAKINIKSSFSFEDNSTFSLTINQTPPDAKITVTNIKQIYYDGIGLEAGSYNIKVIKKGYYPKTGKVDLLSDLSIDVSLKKIPIAPTWIDKDTGLMWQVEIDKRKYNWNSAVAYCSSLTLGGYSDWYLPDGDKLLSIGKKTTSDSDEIYIKKPLLISMDKLDSLVFWSSTEYQGREFIWQDLKPYAAMSVSYSRYDSYDKIYLKIQYYVRCVRLGE